MAAPINGSPPMQGQLQDAVTKLEEFLKVAPPVRDIILTNLSNRDLDAFDIALSKGTSLPNNLRAAFQLVKKQITQKRNERLLKEILTDHPEWKSTVEAWKNVSLEDKIWLLQIYELRDLGFNIPTEARNNLLEPHAKKAIIEALAKVKNVKLRGYDLKKCPRAIGLYVNLESLDIRNTSLNIPPDVSQNIHLQHLTLCDNRLTVAPDVNRNVRLEYLDLDNNQLTEPPDVRKNVTLKYLSLSRNNIKVPPDVSKNVNLQQFSLSTNLLTAPPNISQNVRLECLNLDFNQLKTSPDISKNVNLNELRLTNNPITVPPDVSKNGKLKHFFLTQTKLTAQAKEALAKLKKERKDMFVFWELNQI